MAQLLEHFEQQIEPLVPAEVAEKFKGETRRKLNALAVDACDVLGIDDETLVNAHAQDQKDRVFPDGRAQARKGATQT